jgi:hypothetical protein
MTDTTPDHRRKRAAALVAGSLVVILATGLGAIAFANGKRAKPRPPAITGRIRLKHRDVRSGGIVRGEVVFENHTSKAIVLL